MSCFSIQGDLNQVADQIFFLRSYGFDMMRGTIKSEAEYIRALKLIFDRKQNGWCNYWKDYITYNICTKEDLQKLGFNFEEEKKKM